MKDVHVFVSLVLYNNFVLHTIYISFFLIFLYGSWLQDGTRPSSHRSHTHRVVCVCRWSQHRRKGVVINAINLLLHAWSCHDSFIDFMTVRNPVWHCSLTVEIMYHHHSNFQVDNEISEGHNLYCLRKSLKVINFQVDKEISDTVAQILGDRWFQKYLVRNIMQGDGGCMLTMKSVETWMIERLRASFHTKTKMCAVNR
jgi:hypothetical protein